MCRIVLTFLRMNTYSFYTRGPHSKGIITSIFWLYVHPINHPTENFPLKNVSLIETNALLVLVAPVINSGAPCSPGATNDESETDNSDKTDGLDIQHNLYVELAMWMK